MNKLVKELNEMYRDCIIEADGAEWCFKSIQFHWYGLKVHAYRIEDNRIKNGRFPLGRVKVSQRKYLDHFR